VTQLYCHLMHDLDEGRRFRDAVTTREGVEKLGGMSETSAEGTTHSVLMEEQMAFSNWINMLVQCNTLKYSHVQGSSQKIFLVFYSLLFFIFSFPSLPAFTFPLFPLTAGQKTAPLIQLGGLEERYKVPQRGPWTANAFFKNIFTSPDTPLMAANVILYLMNQIWK